MSLGMSIFTGILGVFKNVCFYGVSLKRVTIIFGFIDYSRFPLPIKSTRSSPINQSGTRRARSADVVGVV